MLKKIFRWLLVLAGVAVLLLGLAAWWVSAYLDSNQEKILSEFVSTSGLSVTFRELDMKAWKTFPAISFTVDSLVVRDEQRPAHEQPLLAAEYLSGSLTLGNLIFDTLRLNHFELRDGAVYVASDSSGDFNLGLLNKKKEPGDSSGFNWLNPKIDWNGMEVRLVNLDLAFLRPERNKRMVVHLDSLRTKTERTPYGIQTDSELAAFVSGISFNTNAGKFLENSALNGQLQINSNNGTWSLAPTKLRIRNESFTFAMEMQAGVSKGLQLQVKSPVAHYDSIAALLPEELRGELEKYHVSDRFHVAANICSNLELGGVPEIDIGFMLAGNDVRLNEFLFREAHTRGAFVNSLATAEGGIPGSVKNFRIELDTTRAYQGPLYLRMPRAIIRGVVGDTHLDAPVLITGPAQEINERVGTENFIFGPGRFSLSTYVNASLNSMPGIIQSSNGRLTLSNTRVLYKPAEVSFPLRSLELSKRGEDIRFKLKSGELSTGFVFNMTGKIDNILPLLLDRPADRIRTDVALHAPRIRWKDFLAMFGEDGVFAGDNEEARTQDAMEGERQVAAMKKALLGLQASFRPQIEARFDTVAYYDVLAVNNFTTGLRFDEDTLVLERTRFDWEDSRLDFGARLGFGQYQATPFQLNVAAEHLNLNRMRSSLEHFGLQLPGGIDSLPFDLKIGFNHQGVINDSFGIRPGNNIGHLTFREGRDDLFFGYLNYAPGPDGLRTKLHLQGDPLLVNQLFAAEDFFFGSGRFRIDLGIDGTPKDLTQLVENADLSLEIDSSKVEYRPAGVFVPIRKFSVHSANERVEYDLELISDSTRRSVALKGTLDLLTAFLYPEPGKTFRMNADATAQSLHWSDIQGFVRRSETDKPDTTSFDIQDLLSATGGIFKAFRPKLSLRVDTFWTDQEMMMTNVKSGLRLKDSTQLILETSGFRLGEGGVALSAAYDIDKQLKSPFKVEWKTDSLALSKVLQVLNAMKITLPEQTGSLAGVLSMTGDMKSKFDEEHEYILLDSTAGDLSLELTGLELRNWPALLKIGRKAKMKKRFETLRFAPLKLTLRLKNGEVWLPRTEIQSTALQLFIEGDFDTLRGPDLLVSIPLRNIGRGLLDEPPTNTGYAAAGKKIYLVMERDKEGKPKLKFRLSRRKYFKERGRLEELKQLQQEERNIRRTARGKGR
jgi:hypothetical protein